MAIMNRKRSRKGFLMTVLVLVLFTLMIAELLIFTLLNISYNKIQQSSLLVSSSVDYASSLISSSKAFAAASLSKALSALTSYEYNASIRKGNFVSNLSEYLSYLIVNGTLPNVAPNSLAANALAIWMGNATFVAYNASIINNIKPSPLAIKISESKPIIYQTSPYNLSVSYVENVSIATPSGIQNYTIPVSASIPLNGTYDLFYAQQGVQRTIRFSSINNLTSVVGDAYATYGNSSSNAFIYGIVLHVPSGVTCTSLSSNVPSWADTAPLNKSIILATPNANLITNATCTIANKFGGLVTYSISSISSPPNIPWLQYSSSTNILNYIPNGTKVLLYGPGMDLLNMGGLRNAIQNGSYFASPFLPSYIDRADANFLRSSPNGIFTFSGSNRYAAQFNGQNNYVEQTNGFGFMNNAAQQATISIWVKPSSPNGDIVDELGQSTVNTGWHDTWIDLVNGQVEIRVWNLGCVNLGPIPLNSWSNIVMTLSYNGASLSYSGYINGVYKNSGTGSRSIPGGSYLMYYPLGPSDSTNCGDGGASFNGQMANYQFYNTSLGHSQISKIYQNGVEGLPVDGQNLVMWWPLNGNANDYSGNGNNGVGTNVEFNHLINYTRDSIYIVPTPNTLPIPGTLSCISGKNCNSALYISKLPLETSPSFYTAQFNGQNNYVEQTNGFGFMNNAAQQATISIWVKPSSPNGDIVDELGQSTVNTGWHDTWIDLVNGQVEIRVWNLGCVNLGPIPLNSWSNIVMTLSYNGASLSYSGYINGVYKNSGTGSRSIPGGSYLMYYPLGPSDSTNCGDGGASFNGQMANYQFYNTSLGHSQISKIYQNGVEGLPVNEQNLVMWWPLNGNANDYSGLGNNGTAYNVYYTPFSGPYPNNGLSTVAGIINEREALNLVG